jgi:hypothetical protein
MYTQVSRHKNDKIKGEKKKKRWGWQTKMRKEEKEQSDKGTYKGLSLMVAH